MQARSTNHRASSWLAGCTALLLFVSSASHASNRDDDVTHHEFQVDCSVAHTLSDDPIVFPGQPGRSHNHTFLGNVTTNAYSTLATLNAGTTTCKVPADRSAYWFPTLFGPKGAILPNFAQVIYYKSGITDYTKLVPFPVGLRFITGDMMATEEEFENAPGKAEGFQCGSNFNNWDFPISCAEGTHLVIRYHSPSCWNGMDLTPAEAAAAGRGKNMEYPVEGVCPADFPVAVPMLEFKISFPVSDMTNLAFASGRGYSWHYDFFNAWEPETLAALVEHCINGGLQCDARGYDQHKPDRGAVLDKDYKLLTSGAMP
jgi:hypothetical protein